MEDNDENLTDAEWEAKHFPLADLPEPPPLTWKDRLHCVWQVPFVLFAAMIFWWNDWHMERRRKKIEAERCPGYNVSPCNQKLGHEPPCRNNLRPPVRPLW